MTDVGLIAKKLLKIENAVRELGLVDAARIESDLIVERFAEHTLQIAIQAVIDIASHIVADGKLGDAETNHALFELLERNGWLSSDLVPILHRMVGFRNILVHEYETVDVRIVRLVVERNANDLLRFVETIRAKLA